MSRIRSFGGGALLGVAVALAVAIAGPLVLGWRTLTVMSGSMQPTIHTGDAVVVRPVRADTVRPGDVVTFRDPGGTGRLITHRVRTVRTTDAGVEVTTRGDANTATEQWRTPPRGQVGRVVYRLPTAGYVLAPTASRTGRLAFVAAPALLLALLVLSAIWRSDDAA